MKTKRNTLIFIIVLVTSIILFFTYSDFGKDFVAGFKKGLNDTTIQK